MKKSYRKINYMVILFLFLSVVGIGSVGANPVFSPELKERVRNSNKIRDLCKTHVASACAGQQFSGGTNGNQSGCTSYAANCNKNDQAEINKLVAQIQEEHDKKNGGSGVVGAYTCNAPKAGNGQKVDMACVEEVKKKFPCKKPNTGGANNYGDIASSGCNLCQNQMYTCLRLIKPTAKPDNDEVPIEETSYNIPSTTCGGSIQLPLALANITSKTVIILEIAVPIILVVLGMIDFMKATASSDADATSKAGKKLVRRIVASVLAVLVVTIVQFVFSNFGTITGNTGVMSCVDCFINNNCKQPVQDTKLPGKDIPE